MIPIGLVFLLYKTVVCDVNTIGGYIYQQPFPPVQFDEPSTPSNVYIPVNPANPPIQDEVIPPPELPAKPNPEYLPSYLYPPNGTPPDIFNDDMVAVSTPPPIYGPPGVQIQILNMSCELDTKFKTLIRVTGRNVNLVPEDGLDNCVIQGPHQNTFTIDMQGLKKMSDCGVTRCANGNSKVNMCVTLRMPTVRNLKLPEDGLVNLQCTPQDNIVAHTKHIRLGSNIISSNPKGRSSQYNTIVASGGNQRKFDTKIHLLKKSPGSDNFDQLLQQGSTVALGEELVLRAAVQEGDGWQYSRMGSVTLKSATNQKIIHLLDDNGCLTPGIRNICPQQPRHLGSLVTILPFRAFLFQGAAKDDVMLLSVRMIGCMRQQDCFQAFCNDGISKSGQRFKRGFFKNNSNSGNDTTNLDSEFQFRVADEPDVGKGNLNTKTVSNEFIVLSVMFGLLIFGSVSVCVVKKIIY